MGDVDEELPELFIVDFHDQCFIGEIIKNYNAFTPTFTGFLQIFDYQTIFVARTKRGIIDIAEELCIIILEVGIHYKDYRSIEILKSPFYLN